MTELLARGAPLVSVAVLDASKRTIGAWPGLIDPGAARTAIPWKCRKLLRVEPERLEPLAAFDPRCPTGRYPVYLVHLRARSLEPVLLEVVAIPRLKRVLLGRDFLQGHVFAYDGAGGEGTVAWFGLRPSSPELRPSLKKFFDDDS